MASSREIALRSQTHSSRTHRVRWAEPPRGSGFPKNVGRQNGGMKDPVCPLRLALYGHPDSGGYWVRHCDRCLLSRGVTKIPQWRSCYLHKEMKLFLIVYVDPHRQVLRLRSHWVTDLIARSRR